MQRGVRRSCLLHQVLIPSGSFYFTQFLVINVLFPNYFLAAFLAPDLPDALAFVTAVFTATSLTAFAVSSRPNVAGSVITLNDLRLEIGAHSSMLTTSPVRKIFASSCAEYLALCLTYFL